MRQRTNNNSIILMLFITSMMMLLPRISSFQLGFRTTKFVLKSHHYRRNSSPATTDTIKLYNSSSKSNNAIFNDDDELFTFHVESFDNDGKWMKIDYDNIPIEKQQLHQQDSENKIKTVFAPIHSSPVETKLIKDKLVYIKRDDLLHLRNSNVSGNKARKMLALNELNVDDFPDVVVSYGGPQSNAMVALAAIVQSKNIQWEEKIRNNNINNSNDSGVGNDEQSESHHIDEIESDGWIMKDEHSDDDYDEDDDDLDIRFHEDFNSTSSPRKKRFVYYTKMLPRYLRNQPNGNLLRALTLGMEMVQLKSDVYRDLFGGEDGGSAIAPKDVEAPVEGSSLWIPQGGACGISTQGAKYMADEIISFWIKNCKGRPLSVCVPGGTCTTAMLLSKELNSKIRKAQTSNDKEEPIDIDVVVIPCVGDADYAFRQMKALSKSLGGNGRDDIPTILKPIKRKSYFRFGEPDAEILKTFYEMRNEHGLFLDLLYGAPAMNVLLEHLDLEYSSDSSNKKSPLQGRQVMYVHSGGLEGVSSQMTRYKHKGLIDSTQVQN